MVLLENLSFVRLHMVRGVIIFIENFMLLVLYLIDVANWKKFNFILSNCLFQHNQIIRHLSWFIHYKANRLMD